MRNRTVLAMLVASLLLGLSPLSADTVIQRGIDVFSTRADGKTFYDFASTPIPAGFFCNSSKAFTDRVEFQGLPITTNPPGRLKAIDTVVERLDDAAFDDRGIATTRIQIRALSLVSIQPIKTACGAFHAYISLGGKQRVSTMTIFRTQENGGYFSAPVAVDARITFIPVKPGRTRSARKFEIPGRFTFPATRQPWSLKPANVKNVAALAVDTNGDMVPETPLPGTSNFLAGQSPDYPTTGALCSCCPTESCHDDPNKGQHCNTVPQCGMSCC